MNRICLTMIVKDEAEVMPRCLGALKPYIDSALIIDTGSTDNTKELIPTLLDEVTVEEEPFVSFKHNRSRLLERAREVYPDAEYHLMIDADDTFEPRPGFEWGDLVEDAYFFRHTLGSLAWWRPQLFRANKPFYYKGDAHEVASCDEPYTMERLHGLTVRCGRDGARQKKEGVKKYARVAGILEASLKKNPWNRRDTFYLAQSYRDSNQNEKALEYYEKRAKMGGWPEEIWYSMYQIGRLLGRVDAPLDEVLRRLEEAFEYRPTRIESLVDAALACRLEKRFSRAFMYAATAIAVPYPEKDRLFVDYHAYEWRRWDEYAMACWHQQRYDDALWANFMILNNPEAEGYNKDRMISNITHCCQVKEHFDKLKAVWELVAAAPPKSQEKVFLDEVAKDDDLRPHAARILTAIRK